MYMGPATTVGWQHTLSSMYTDIYRARIFPVVLFANIWGLDLLAVKQDPLISAQTKRKHSKIRLCTDTYTLGDV